VTDPPHIQPARAHEMFFNGVPFYSVLPNTERYPCLAWGGPMDIIEQDSDGEGPRTPSMSAARIAEDLPELLDAASALIDGRLTYEQAHEQHWPRLLRAYHGDRSPLAAPPPVRCRALAATSRR
jgi:hypothetical protein